MQQFLEQSCDALRDFFYAKKQWSNKIPIILPVLRRKTINWNLSFIKMKIYYSVIFMITSV